MKPRPTLLPVLLLLLLRGDAAEPRFLAGAASRDLTPREPVPMWGYGGAGARLSEGAEESLRADALVIQARGRKLALVGLDLGRSPSEESLARIRGRLAAELQIEASFLGGSHTHHAPVMELSDRDGRGRGRYDAALRWYREAEDAIVAAVAEADARREPAAMAAVSRPIEGFNRNRHTKLEPKPVDRDLAVALFTSADGTRNLATLVNFAAHPTMLPSALNRFSPDYVGALKDTVTNSLGGVAVFLQGAAGDLSVDRRDRPDHRALGAALGNEAVALTRTLRPAVPASPSLETAEERLRFEPRMNLSNPAVRAAFSVAFFPELVANYADEYAEGVRPRLTVALLNGEIGLVGVSGEVFSAHSLRLKERARLPVLFFAGYANGYHQYLPTIEAVAEGGYGADAPVAPAAVGAGEELMNMALKRLYELRGRTP
ncbi:MAG: hypothetical protein ACKVYV_07815 [Limisphaerales bacterium]